ncbi:SDR family oxidoreductase [Herbiconiux sp. SYSU D00978]|uniref:SDR family oxidoreductase n=1 Tax=Herbiconiux sp. SYSU D00978 TaxID=2812562 RepID=UPI001A966812|nr:SDR family oxidoreductase [Herbiconiux sp. SYSU D00978]
MTTTLETPTDAALAPRPIGRVLITGGASGLGRAVAQAVAAAGGTPVVLDLNTEGVDVEHRYSVDVSDRHAVEEAVSAAAAKLGGLDAVVTAAGIDRPAAFGDVSAEQWEYIVGVNLFGTVSTVRAAMPYLLESHGRVVTVASSLGVKAVGDATAYCASKFGVVGFTRSLAAETKGKLGVTLLIPTGMKTKFFDDRDERYKPQDDSRLNDPENVANAILFALSQPPQSEVRELVITHAEEDSWP